MSLLQVVNYIVAFTFCYFSFTVLRVHYTEEKTWKAALVEGGKQICIGLVIAIANPIGLTVLGIIAAFIILTLGDIL